MGPYPKLATWEARYPECGGLVVYGEVEPGSVVGACCAESEAGCWWAG